MYQISSSAEFIQVVLEFQQVLFLPEFYYLLPALFFPQDEFEHLSCPLSARDLYLQISALFLLPGQQACLDFRYFEG